MKNFSVEIDGETHWVSRSVAVAGFVFRRIGNQLTVLANKRGNGLPNQTGKWNCPCGFLDYNEDAVGAFVREVWEETGINLNELETYSNGFCDFTPRADFVGITTDPSFYKQTVVLRYTTFITNNNKLSKLKFSTKNAEPNEVDEIKWIPVDELNDYEWAFDHKKIIADCVIKYWSNCGVFDFDLINSFRNE